VIDAATWVAIAEAYAIYARACDEKRYDLFARVFAPEAELDYRVAGHDFACRGDEVPKAFAEFLGRCFWTQHLIAHPMVEREGDTLRASARVTATHLQRRRDGSTNRWLVRGAYDDTFALRSGEWRIVRRICVCVDAEGDFELDVV
jgi:3-phenylpropionate/cinnamic acid dioxygenase small subunit